MNFPIGFYDISLLLTVTSIILLITYELNNNYYGQLNLVIEKGRIRKIILLLVILYLLTVVINIYQIIITL